jgi:hypothetical protein
MAFDPIDNLALIFETSPYIFLGWCWGTGRIDSLLWWLVIAFWLIAGQILSASLKSSSFYKNRSTYKLGKGNPQ